MSFKERKMPCGLEVDRYDSICPYGPCFETEEWKMFCDCMVSEGDCPGIPAGMESEMSKILAEIEALPPED